MKMTAFALGVKCDFFGASGLTNDAGVAAAARLKNPSPESNPVSATAPKPPPVSQRNSRRVRRQNWQASSFIVETVVRRLRLSVRTLSRKRLIQVDELV